MKLLSIITLPAVLVGFAHASVHATPHASSHASAHTSSHVSSHSSAHTSGKSSTSKISSSKPNSSKTSKPSSKSTGAKSSSHYSFFPWWGTSNHKEKNGVDQIKKEIKALNKSDQQKIKKYVDDLVK
ncbi:hypothetical protein [Enterococcus mundtii]|uniref:hypothetical protein n=1 Tax=Enterococcus mundtii TaxID=53346 RepID=UPI001898D531|nr:hypothetical protein [Enterococcus mundtii]MDB7101875.1 hypothetical protein [Enterococcus mundtii]